MSPFRPKALRIIVRSFVAPRGPPALLKRCHQVSAVIWFAAFAGSALKALIAACSGAGMNGLLTGIVACSVPKRLPACWLWNGWPSNWLSLVLLP